MSEIYWSSALSSLSALSAVEKGRVIVSSVTLGIPEVIFEQDYDIGYGGLTVTGIDKVIENDLASRDLPYANYNVKVKGLLSVNAQMNTFVDIDALVIHCPRPMPVSAEDYLKGHFLLPPSDYPGVLRLPAWFSEPLSVHAFLASGDDFTVSLLSGDLPTDAPWDSETSTLGTGMHEIPLVCGDDVCRSCVAVCCGERSFTVSFTEPRSEHGVLLRYRNLFNMTDYLYVDGITERTPSVSYEEVSVNGTLRHADIRRGEEVTMSVEGLSAWEAERVAELLPSLCVERLWRGRWERIVVTDVGSVSNDPSSLNSIKLKYKLARL